METKGLFSMGSHRNEDTVYYKLFFSEPRASAADLITEISSHLSQFTSEYIWQKDPFELSADPTGPQNHLIGSTTYGDNIEDEWFIVFLLFHLTKKYPDLVVQLYDTDGEFLLIEAALELPSWLNPETSENRTFVHKGKLHIVPLPQSPADVAIFPGGDLQLERALGLVRGEFPTEASTPVQTAIFSRIEGYPFKAKESFHRAKCLIPKKVAHLLNNSPQLVAPAVEAFYLRDPVGLKACTKMANFDPNDSVLTTVRFTKCLFAQLASQEFYPPKAFKLPPTNSPQFKAADLGMKLACGFEIVVTDRFYQVPNIEDPDDISSYPFHKSSRWGTYMENLVQRGYFRTEKEGSALYKKLEEEAKKNFLTFESESRQQKSLVFSDPVRKIREILETIPINEETLISHEAPDSEKWLELTPEEFEKLLVEQQKKMEAQEETENDMFNESFASDESDDNSDEEDDDDTGDRGEVNEEELKTVSDMVNGIKSFMENVSGYEGAEVPGEQQQGPLDFDPEEFLNALKRTVGALEDLEGKLGKNQTPPGRQKAKGQKPKPPTGPTIEEIMDAMDAELSTTKMAEDFERLAPRPRETPGKGEEMEPKNDHEEGQGHSGDENSDVDDREEEDSRPVDLNLNLVKNLLESFSSQQGMSGPASSLLSSLGLDISHDSRK